MKCFKCGTEYNGIECPTCAQKRLSEERNRLLEEQNRELEGQRKENERQTRELERHNELLEQDKRERNYEKQREKDREAFDTRLEELSQYAVERGLTSVFVYAKYPMEDILIDNYLEGDTADIREKIINIYTECTKDFSILINSLDSDDRILKASDYGMCFTPEFKLGNLQQIIESHDYDFVIVPNDMNLALFPLDMIKEQNLKGYSGKNIKIGEFNYLMFLKNKKEANSIAKTLSETLKRYTNTKDKIKKSMENYINSNPKPKSYDIDYKDPKTSSGFIYILAIIGAIIGGYIGKVVFQMDSIFVILVFAFFGVIGFGFIASKIYEIIDDGKKKEKYEREQEKKKEAEKLIENWRTEMRQHIENCMENILEDITKNKYLS
jgi:DNA-directed RNA polymerase subunit RPC12/RpoP